MEKIIPEFLFLSVPVFPRARTVPEVTVCIDVTLTMESLLGEEFVWIEVVSSLNIIEEKQL